MEGWTFLDKCPACPSSTSHSGIVSYSSLLRKPEDQNRKKMRPFLEVSNSHFQVDSQSCSAASVALFVLSRPGLPRAAAGSQWPLAALPLGSRRNAGTFLLTRLK